MDATDVELGHHKTQGSTVSVLAPFLWLRRLVAGLAFFCITLPVIAVLLFRWVPPPTSSFMLQYAFTNTTTVSRSYWFQWVNWEQIAPELLVAVVAAEDQKFASHWGFDIEAIEDAIEEQRLGRRTRGASGITQQVAKNLFLWPQKSLLRKALEAGFTVMLELAWSKERILEVYVNIAEFGPGIYGVSAASNRYFSKTPAVLSPREAALLAAVLPNPRRLHADRPSAYVEGRVQWILQQIDQLGGISLLKKLQ
jgi:monofunctional biosynthetic peptidoglycan transglycosylase